MQRPEFADEFGRFLRSALRAHGARLADLVNDPNTQHKEQAMRASILFDRIRGEFNEMPGLQLTIAQAARLWGMDQASCRRVIDALVEAAFLRWTPSGTVVRAER
jgi:hypothetical protein